ncbi:MAG: hypothetical protein AB1Z51_12685 [Desulfuromonadales bacterium]
MRRYVCLSILLGSFALLTVYYSFLMAFCVMNCASILVVIETAFSAGYRKRLKAAVLADQPVYPAGKELMGSNRLHAA